MIKLASLKEKPNNPRFIKDAKFKKLVKSIKEFPKMMELRPLIIDSDRVVIGGNMRLRAMAHLKMHEIPDNWVKSAKDLTLEEIKKFVITDNAPFGEWDHEILGTDYEIDFLNDCGLDDFALGLGSDDDSFGDTGVENETEKSTIKLEYSPEEYALVQKSIKKTGKTAEMILWEALGL